MLLFGSALMGVGNSANQLARYAATDAHPVERRGLVLGWVLWASTIGAIAGPMLGTAVADATSALGGAYAVGVGCYALAAAGSFMLLRPDPAAIASESGRSAPPEASDGSDESGSARARVAVLGLVTSQSVMLLLMTMAPVYLSQLGAPVSAIGWVMSSHVLGMYSLTPVAGGLVDRYGAYRVLGIGLALLVAAGLAGAMADGALALAGAMFLLGWSCGFVASSGLLAVGDSYAERAKRQGRADGLVFAAATLASLASGPLLGAIGYAGLCLTGTALVAPAAVAVARGGGRQPASLDPAPLMNESERAPQPVTQAGDGSEA